MHTYLHRYFYARTNLHIFPDCSTKMPFSQFIPANCPLTHGEVFPICHQSSETTKVIYAEEPTGSLQPKRQTGRRQADRQTGEGLKVNRKRTNPRHQYRDGFAGIPTGRQADPWLVKPVVRVPPPTIKLAYRTIQTLRWKIRKCSVTDDKR